MVFRMAVWWFATLAWAAEIFCLSTATFGGSLSQSLLTGVLNSFHLSVSPYTLHILNAILRKFAHLAEYAILSVLLYESLRAQNGLRWQPRLASWCVVAAAAYSLTDEFHQAFSQGRGASLIDCGIDTIGAAVGALLIYGAARLSGAGRWKGRAQ